MKLSLVIPCYNEAANLPLLLERCALVAEHGDVEVIIVDNGSTDETKEMLLGLLSGTRNIRSVHVPVNQGYGHGIVAGLRAARGEIIGWTHADLQTDPVDVLAALSLIEKADGPVYVKGRRYGRPFADVLFTLGMSCFESMLLLRPLWDINAQPNLFPGRFFDELEDPPDDFSLDLYVYYKAIVSGLPVVRFPVRFGERAHGVSHWNVNWRAKWRFIRRTVEFSLKLRARL